jgi:hypothetical protein
VVAVLDAEIVPMLERAPSSRPIAIFAEMQRRHPELTDGVRRTMEGRIRQWRAHNHLLCCIDDRPGAPRRL